MRSANTPKLGRLALTRAEFTSLTSIDGGSTAVQKLALSQVLKRKYLVAGIRHETRDAEDAPARTIQRAIGLLAEAESADRDAALSVLGHPYLDQWAARWLRAEGDRGEAADYLATIAAAAAARARMTFAIDVHSSDGTVVLPTLGAGTGLGPGRVRIDGAPDRITLTGPAGRADVPRPFTAAATHWEPVRRFDLDGRYAIAVEDLDTQRDCYPWPPRNRLDDATAARFRDTCRAAWSIISADFPEHAEGMRTALASLVPLAHSEDVESQGATAFRAFGSLAVSLDMSAEALALSLVHEFMHMKLVAILDQYDLHAEGRRLYFAPWRSDPRPISALLHGAYAHFGVCDFWRRRRGSAPDRSADFEFALWRRLTLRAVRTLLDSEELTPLGRDFVRPLDEALRAWAAEPVPADIDRAAADVAYAYWVRWDLTYGASSAAELERLAGAPRPPWLPAAWSAAPGPAPDEASGGAAEPAVATLIRSIVVGGEAADGDPRLIDAVVAHVGGRADRAAHGFRTAIDGGAPDGWVGLCVASRRGAPVRRPRLVRRLYEAAGGTVAPADVAAWVSAVLDP
ncbi:aKG-HExxH-type peptide beta-hydroxylase [Dactylosporangium sp. CS-047395]|uniref:aKG-HExxH-type peptide beta-hydroxylase n=1 Tax=Dactylosporangium sp. CS-047395 TaxID=3239936 RepID=UPI003D8FDC66